MFDVVGVGANSLDRVYRLPRYPHPDSPDAKMRISGHRLSPGGQTATVLSTCASLGLRAAYIGTVGGDDAGRRMTGALAGRGVNIDHVVIRDASSPYAVILIDDRHGERVVLWDRDPALALRPEEVDRDILRHARLIHVDDADQEAAIRAASIGRQAAVPVTSDIEAMTERTEALVAAVTIPIFAEHVLSELTGEADVERALRKIRRQHAGLLCVTLGSRGAIVLEGDALHHEPAVMVKTMDTTGAGDVFRGAFIHAYLKGVEPAGILRFANAAAALSCTREGAMDSVPTLDEVDRLAATRSTTVADNPRP